MDADLPYLMTPKRFPELLEKLQVAAVPDRVTFNMLKKLGFSSSNDRAFVGLLKRLGMIDENGKPTDRYGAFRNKKRSKKVLGEAIREAYDDLFSVHTDIQNESLDDIKAAVSSVTGREQRYVNLIANTFKTLCDSADFAIDVAPEPPVVVSKEAEPKSKDEAKDLINNSLRQLSFHYNIEIHLPATTDISVYNAIFRSLRENLGEA